MVDWRTGQTGGGLQVQQPVGCDPGQQYRHGQAGPYPGPGAMNGVLHHQPPQPVRRQAAGYPGAAPGGSVYPVSAAGVGVTGPGYGQPPGGIKTSAGQYGMGADYGRPMAKYETNVFVVFKKINFITLLKCRTSMCTLQWR